MKRRDFLRNALSVPVVVAAGIGALAASRLPLTGRTGVYPVLIMGKHRLEAVRLGAPPTWAECINPHGMPTTYLKWDRSL